MDLADGKGGNRPQKKQKLSDEKNDKKTDPDRSVHSSFHIRINCDKTGPVDQWITGSMDQPLPDIVEVLQERFPQGRVSLEKGKNGGLLHWQCTAALLKGKRERRPVVRKLLLEHYPECNFPKGDYCEPCDKKWASMQYCAKDDCTHICGPWEWGLDNVHSRDLKKKDLPEPYEWQKKLLEKYKDEPPAGFCGVHWYAETTGQVGKTTTGKMMALEYDKDFYLLDGGAQKMKFQAAKNPARVYAVNFSREREDLCPYAGLEAICDNFYCDTFGSDQKGMIVRRPSWVIVFANFFPDESKLSDGRLTVFKFVDNKWI